MSTSTDLICPELTESEAQLLAKLSYWLEGVFLVGFAFLGIVGNCLTSLVLARREMLKNSFYVLLMALSIFDTTYLVRKRKGFTTFKIIVKIFKNDVFISAERGK